MADYGSVARPYARALFELARGSNELAGWSAALAAAAAVVREPAAREHLARPELADDERAAFVVSLATEVDEAGLLASEPGKNLLRLLAANDRLAALPEIAAQFDELKAEAENKVKVSITAAAPVDAALADKLARALAAKLGREVELELAVDASLIGGAVIRAEDLVIDGSVRSRLKRLAERLIA